MNPEQLGPYRIVGVLGRGGMGAVYRGVNIDTDEPAAVKILAADLAHEEGFRQRFEAEIETLRKLYHHNIVQLFGFGEQDGILFYAMELVEGRSLEDELRRGRRFDWREAAQIGIQTCHALRHAHDRGITHRDIKPANLLLTQEGEVKLSDFGIARLFGYSRMTAAGNVLGTVEYMAPEQADGKPVGPRTDLYSLGGVLFALLAGRPPFRARSLGEMLDKQRSAVPEPIRCYVPEVPEEFEHLIAQLLEKDPDKRVSNATLVSRRLEAMSRALAPEAGTRVELPKLPEPIALSAPPASLGGPPTAESADKLTGPPAQPSAGDAPAEELPETRFDSQFGKEPLTADDVLSPPPPGELLETRAAEDVGAAPRPQPMPPPEAESLGETQEASDVYGLADSSQSSASEGRTIAGPASRTQGRFVVVGEEDLDRVEEEPRPQFSLHTGILAGALVAVGLLVWYFLRPPTSDALYARIAAKTTDKSIASYMDAEREIDDFLQRFSTDSRSFRLREYKRDIELYKLERKLERRTFASPVRDRASSEGLLPIERAYIRAMNLSLLDPDEAIVRLQRIVDLYGDPPLPSGPTGECVELAQRKLEVLRRQQEGAAADALAEVESRLHRAEDLLATDPDIARKIFQAVVDSCQDKSWAAEAVRRARDGLAAAKSGGAPKPHEGN